VKYFSASAVQRLQMFNLLTLMFIGKLVLNFPITWVQIGAVIAFGILLEHAILFYKQRALTFFSYSAVSTALGVTFLLRAVDLYIFLIVMAIAILQKHFLKIDGKHFLNPSNVAVIAGLSLFPYQTYTSPEQWGAFWWLGVLMMILGFYITSRVRRAIIPLVFAISYAAMIYVFLTHNLAEIFLILISGSFLLFMFFMLTDPRTTPETNLGQIVFALVIAIIAIVLELFIGVKDINIFLALFVVSFTVPWVRGFEWLPVARKRFSIALGTLAVLVLSLYFSDYNIVRNMEKLSPDTHHTMQTQTIAEPTEPISAVTGWSDANASLYETDWKNSHIVVMPYRKNREYNDTTFPDVSKQFASYNPHLERKHMGWDFMHHSALSSGDINHDGYLDLIIAKPTRELSVWINDQDGNFSDVTREIFKDGIPRNVDVVALADMNNDSWLDLIVLNNLYANPDAKHALYMYDQASKSFKLAREFDTSFGVTGGLATYDINRDGILDLYVVNSRNWNTEDRTRGFMRSHGLVDQFWVSNKGTFPLQKRPLRV